MSNLLISDFMNEETKISIIQNLRNATKKYQLLVDNLEKEISIITQIIKDKLEKYQQIESWFHECRNEIESKIAICKNNIASQILKKNKYILEQKESIESEILEGIKKIKIDTSSFEKEIEQLHNNIDFYENQLAEIDRKNIEIKEFLVEKDNGSQITYELIRKEIYMAQYSKKYNKLKKEKNNAKLKYDACCELEKLIEYVPDYINYAKEKMPNYEEFILTNISIKDLIKKCNEFHQKYLLTESNNGRGWHSNRTRDSCTDCNGWYYNDKRCECGNFKNWCWNSDGVDFSKVKQFTIFNTAPFGYVDIC